ncbi:MAG: hypothetical protein LBH91_08860 [Prevotellaceae bacterium]|nr:hypothetical protein [Prevotellaceae bacterium]
MIADIENNFENFIAALDIDSYAKTQLQILFSELIAMDEDDSITSDDIFDKVVIFETKVLNNTITIPSNSKETVLACTSTLRHSLSFWYDELVETRAAWWKWVVIGLSDAAGLAGGIALGGGTGAISAGVACSSLANTLLNLN